MDYERSTPKKSSGNDSPRGVSPKDGFVVADNSIRSMISNGAFRFPKTSCAHWRNWARSTVLPITGGRRCGKWKKRFRMIYSQKPRVIPIPQSREKNLTVEVWITQRAED